jgi:hypothetical protein
MIDLHLKIDENNYDFFIELIKKFEFVKINEQKKIKLSKQQKEIINKRKEELLSEKIQGIELSEIEKLLK